ncbi:MAG: RDD family protein [Chloroflexi bacterium]|nr:RDD family protein [Chloroflexota bacterium]
MDAPQAVAQENITGRRVVAALIDVLILTVVFVVMSIAFGDTETGRRETGNGETTGVWVNLTGWPLVLYLVIVLAYYTILEATLHQTVGKIAMGLEVVSLAGKPLTIGQVALRTILRVVDGLPFLYLVGIISIAASKEHQRIGDMAAKTNVVRTGPS